MTDLWCPNVLSCAFDASSFCPPRAVDPHIPSLFNPVLEVEDRGYTIGEVLMAWTLGFRNIRDQHLDIAIATESALAGHLADMTNVRTTEKGTLNGLVLLTEFGKYGNEIVRLILYDRVSCQSPVRGKSSLLCGSAALLQQFVQPRRHLLFMSIGSQFRALKFEVSSMFRRTPRVENLTPSRFAPSGPMVRGGLRARPGLDELVLSKYRSASRLPRRRDTGTSNKSS